jgi:membrane protein implicated in regulation of membrane protease activity
MFSGKKEAKRMAQRGWKDWFWLALAVIWIALISSNDHLNPTLRVLAFTAWTVAGLAAVYRLVKSRKHDP